MTEPAFRYFVDAFILKEKQARFLYLATEKRWHRFSDELHRTDYCLNNKCKLVEKNASVQYDAMVKELDIQSGYYVEKYNFGVKKLDVLHLEPSDDSIFICPDKKVAFVFFHEGWIFFCRE